MNQYSVLQLNIVGSRMEDAITYVCDHLAELKGKYVTFVNVHCMVMACERQSYQRIQKSAVLAFPDGMPIARLVALKSRQKVERISGPDFMKAILDISEEKGYSHYFYGSSENVLFNLSEQLKKQYPNMRFDCFSPEYSEVLKDDYSVDIKRINDFHPDFVWVGLGAPKQECWMEKARGQVDGLMLGVGAAFDFYAETKKRAPEWMQKAGLEWFYRLCQEPKRLAERYIVTNLKFVILMLEDFIKGE